MPILKQLFAPAVVWGVDGSGVCTSIQTLRILQDGCRRTLLIVERRFKYNRCVANFAPSIIFMKGNTILGNSFFSQNILVTMCPCTMYSWYVSPLSAKHGCTVHQMIITFLDFRRTRCCDGTCLDITHVKGTHI